MITECKTPTFTFDSFLLQAYALIPLLKKSISPKIPQEVFFHALEFY
jgi:hypothetical protein